MGADFSTVGGLLANRARSAMIDCLMDGRAMTAGELARVARVAPSTASGHLNDLAGGGLLRMVSVGRHRYYALASAEVATALEALSRICPPTEVRSLRQSAEARRMRLARTCYDHLAGLVAVRLLDQLVARRLVTAGSNTYSVTTKGRAMFAELGVDVDGAAELRRSFARPCLDWTERRPHLAGALGAATTTALLDREWFTRRGRTRGLVITPAGSDGLAETFGVDVDDARAQATTS